MSPLTAVIIAIDAALVVIVCAVFFVVFIALSDRRTARWEFRIRKWRAARRPPAHDHERLLRDAQKAQPAPPPHAPVERLGRDDGPGQ